MTDVLEPKIIRGSLFKGVFNVLACAAFAVFGVMMIRDGGPDAISGWFALVFFGGGGLVLLVTMVRPQVLTLDAQGFTISGGVSGKPRKTAWADIEDFFVYKLPRGGKMIGFNYVPSARKDGWMAKANQAFGADGALPKGWPGKPEDLAAELNAYRARALAAKP